VTRSIIPVCTLCGAAASTRDLALLRHLILPDVGVEGQKKLKAARVLLVARAGSGRPRRCTSPRPASAPSASSTSTWSTRPTCSVRSCTAHPRRVSKLESARARINDLNPNVRVETFETHLTSENALDIIREFDIVATARINFPTRYLVNDACVLLDKPNVYGSIFRFEGQASVFHAKRGPCYRCLYAEPPPPGLVPSCAEGGVLGVLPGHHRVDPGDWRPSSSSWERVSLLSDAWSCSTR